MEKGRQTPGLALLAGLVLGLALAASPGAATAAASAGAPLPASAPPGLPCHTVTERKRVRRWARVKKKRRIHGRRVVVRRHGKIVYVRARVWRRRTVTRAICAPAPALALPPSAPAVLAPLSAPAAPPGPATPVSPPPELPVSHLEYVLQDTTTSVYDMDNAFKLIKTIPMPQDADGVRGVSVSPSRHLMYVMHGGDGPINGSGDGSVLAWDLLSEKAAFDVKLSSGIDSGQVSPDGSKLYVPTGENDSSGIWKVLSGANGALLGTIQGGSGAHNTVISNDGRYVYLGGRLSSTLYVYETQTGKTKAIGPLVGSVRPLTANGSNTLAFTTATNFDGFQVSSLASAKVLFTVSFATVPSGFRFTAPSHGISLSPDERQLYVIDSVHKVIQFYDVSQVKEGVAPAKVATVPVAGLGEGSESGCRYDCGYGGWLQLSRDGRYLFVGDSGEVIDTATRKVITTLSTLAQTKKSIEVDWQNGVPVATSGRTGVGFVE